MYARLFAESGLSLDRLKALLEVAAAGSIVKATGGDAVKQSQYSRQIKELEEFFRVKLVERHGKGIRLTQTGRELARISRFFMLGLSKFQRGCLAEDETFRIGAGVTFNQTFLLPLLSGPEVMKAGTRFIVETAGDDEIERRLHDLTLDFGVTARRELSRPLQTAPLASWRLKLWVPFKLQPHAKVAAAAFREKRLPMVLALRELEDCGVNLSSDQDPRLVCGSFVEAMSAMRANGLASVLPDFLDPVGGGATFYTVRVAALQSLAFRFHLAWNPRMLRLNPHAIVSRDFLAGGLSHRSKD